MNKHGNKEKASTTLEAIIIFPTILIMIFALMFAFEVMYQYVVLEYAASYGATRGAMMWQYDVKELDFINGGGKKEGLYHDIDELLSGGISSDRKKMIVDETTKIVKSLSIFGGDVDVEPTYKGALTGRTITVSVSQKVAIPFDAILEYFDDDVGTLKAGSAANIYDPDEFIRNIDYGYELSSALVKQISEKFDDVKKNRKK